MQLISNNGERQNKSENWRGKGTKDPCVDSTEKKWRSGRQWNVNKKKIKTRWRIGTLIDENSDWTIYTK